MAYGNQPGKLKTRFQVIQYKICIIIVKDKSKGKNWNHFESTIFFMPKVDGKIEVGDEDQSEDWEGTDTQS